MKLKLFTLALSAIALASCGSGSSETQQAEESKDVIVYADKTDIKGDLKGCYTVVNKDYKVKFATKSYENDYITVELLRTDAPLPYDRKNVTIFPDSDKSPAEFCAGFGIEILDAHGDVIDKKAANATPYSWDDMTAALQLLEDETTTISFYFDDLSQAAGFRITSIVLPNTERKTAVGDLFNSVDVNVDEETKDALDTAEKAMEMTSSMLDLLNELQ